MQKQLTQSEIILYTHGAAVFQLLYAGCALKLFELLYERSKLSSEQIVKAANLAKGSARVLLFGLTATRLLLTKNGKYYNCRVIQELFSRGEWHMFETLVLFQEHVVYPGQVDYVESLKQSKNIGVRRYPGKGETIYERLAHDKNLRRAFYDYMEAYSEYANPHLIQNIDLSKARSVLDVGGGGGGNAIALARAFPNIEVTLLDLPVAAPLAKANIKRQKLSQRIRFYPANMFQNEFPKNQDVVLFIHQLVIWSEKQNRLLLKKAYRSLNKGGQVVIFSSIADDNEQGPLMAALDTVYFNSVAAGSGMIYPWEDYEKLLRKTGFKKVERIRCNTWTPHGIVRAYK